MAGSWQRITWRGRNARAWVPDPIAAEDYDVAAAVARRTERAAAQLRRADELLPVAWEPMARVLLRAEGVASSNIEGLRARIEEVVLAEVDDTGADPAAAWIADNLAVISDAIRASRRRRLSMEALNRWHRRLMRHSELPSAMVGRLRTSQGWIGGTSPLDAVYVPPPEGRLPELMRDLVGFADREDLDAVTQAAVLHAQFETIHPYGDGNGRMGRLLVGWLLARRLHVWLPPPVSVLIARDPGGYLSGLHQFREGSVEDFIGWFADIVARAGEASAVLCGRIGTLLTGWDERVADLRADAAARRLVAMLPAHPVLTAAVAAALTQVSERSARNALEALADRQIIAPAGVRSATPGRPRAWWVARELLDLVAAWAR